MILPGNEHGGYHLARKSLAAKESVSTCQSKGNPTEQTLGVYLAAEWESSLVSGLRRPGNGWGPWMEIVVP